MKLKWEETRRPPWSAASFSSASLRLPREVWWEIRPLVRKGRTIRPHLMKMNASLARNLPTNHTAEARGASYCIKPELLWTSAHCAHYSGFKRFIFLPLKKNDLILVRWLDYISPHQGYIGFKVCVYCVEVTKLTPTRFFMLQKRAVGIINLSKWLSVY